MTISRFSRERERERKGSAEPPQNFCEKWIITKFTTCEEKRGEGDRHMKMILEKETKSFKRFGEMERVWGWGSSGGEKDGTHI